MDTSLSEQLVVLLPTQLSSNDADEGVCTTSKGKEQAMYVAIRRLKLQPGSIDEAVRRAENGLVPILSSVPGFVEYDVVQVGEDVGLTISVIFDKSWDTTENR